MPNLAESFLALFAGRERATTIYGDLTEMAQTRGRLWFIAAYARTLFSLTWRLVLALFVASVGRQMIFDLFHLYLRIAPPTWRTTLSPAFLNSSGPLLACIMSTLWFVLPFAAVRYGLRDRFVQLTFAVAVGTTIAFLYMPWASLLFAAATLVLATAALLSATWRKPLEILIWTGAIGFLMIAAVDAVRIHYHPTGYTGQVLARYGVILTFQASLLAAAFVCSRMHNLLLPTPPAAGSPLAGD